jgi:hypothetical protein
MGKNVPERNIMGKLMTFPITLAVSGFFVNVPTSMPIEEKSIGPRIKKGISHTVSVMLAFQTKIPTETMSKKLSVERKMYQSTFEASHSILVSGVKDNCLNSFDFLYSELMLTSENMGLINTENPMSPGIRKSTYLVC